MTKPVIEAKSLSKSFDMTSGTVHALKDVELTIHQGEYLSVTGPSGCGKSTLLHLLGLIEEPTAGTLLLDGINPAGLSDAERSATRLNNIGFVFQRFYLLPMLTAQENVMLPMVEAGASKTAAIARARELLAYVNLEHRFDHRPTQISGGEMQRVAIARALANEPKILLADEPTGELDEKTSHQISSVLQKVQQDGTTIVLVTHDLALANEAERQLRLSNGAILNDGVPSP